MVRKSYTPEQILNKLREAEALLSQGATLAVVWKKIGVSDNDSWLAVAAHLHKLWQTGIPTGKFSTVARVVCGHGSAVLELVQLDGQKTD